jgi:hypothetical protein
MALVLLAAVVLLALTVVLSGVAGERIASLRPMSFPAIAGLGTGAIGLAASVTAYALAAATHVADCVETSRGMEVGGVIALVIAPTIIGSGVLGIVALGTPRPGAGKLSLLVLPLALAAGVVDVLAVGQVLQLCFTF